MTSTHSTWRRFVVLLRHGAHDPPCFVDIAVESTTITFASEATFGGSHDLPIDDDNGTKRNIESGRCAEDLI